MGPQKARRESGWRWVRAAGLGFHLCLMAPGAGGRRGGARQLPPSTWWPHGGPLPFRVGWWDAAAQKHDVSPRCARCRELSLDTCPSQPISLEATLEEPSRGKRQRVGDGSAGSLERPAL